MAAWIWRATSRRLDDQIQRWAPLLPPLYPIPSLPPWKSHGSRRSGGAGSRRGGGRQSGVTAAGAMTAREAEGAELGGGERSSSNPLSAPISTMEVCVLLFLLLEPIAIVFVIFNGHNGGEAGGKRELTRCRPQRGRCQGQRAARRMAKVGARAAMVMVRNRKRIKDRGKWRKTEGFKAKKTSQRDSSRTVTTHPKDVGLVSTQRALVQIFMLKDPMIQR
uniref:Uncharacterized protein n=1 Tax=Oryza glaberrima TaxID=4538 RepID=I1P9L5_ORYGL